MPAATAMIEWARGHAGSLALPWASFAQTQHRDVPLLQLAAYGGEPLVGIVVVAANVALVQLVVARARARKGSADRRGPALVLGAVVAAHLLGAALLAREIDGEERVVAAVHNLVSAFRAAESGRPLVLASNTRPSWIIDARGRVVARAPRAFEPAVVIASVRTPAGQTPYRRIGDATWGVPLFAAVALVRWLSRRAFAPRRDPRRCYV